MSNAWEKWLLIGVGILALCLPVFGVGNETESKAVANPDAKIRVGVITTDFVLPGKLHLLQSLAAAEGITLTGYYVDRSEGNPSSWLAENDLVFLDTPRGNDRARLMASVNDSLAASETAWIAVGGGPPKMAQLPPAQGRALMAYYAGGGEENFRNMMRYLRAWKQGSATADIPPAVALPRAGFYHPDAPHFFTRWQDYQDWGRSRWPENAPVLAVAMASTYVASGQTAVDDSLIAAIEQSGAVPLMFWYDRRTSGSITSLLKDAQPQMLVNTTHMVNEALKQELMQLDIPLVMGLGTRSQSPHQWRGSAQGMQAGMAASMMTIPEMWGMTDPIVLSAIENGNPVAIPEQIALLVDRFHSMVRLRTIEPAQKKIALLFWNSPGGEKNLSASNLNVPRSIEQILQTLKNTGYTVALQDEAALIEQAQAMLSAYYDHSKLDRLRSHQQAEILPLSAYLAWLDNLPDSVRSQLIETWGAPEAHWAIRSINGEPHFVIPLVTLGQFALLPQPPRADQLGENVHDLVQAPGHLYLATYLYLRETFEADALVHLGTHGTQEWTPGKDRGLWAYDFPNLAVGSTPVFYPYIQDNIGEAMQAKRRGRATVVSHQTPPFAPSGFYDELQDIHHLIHQYQQLESGAVQDATLAQLLEKSREFHMPEDMGWSDEAIDENPLAFVSALHDHMHELAQTTTPIGLHTFGLAAEEKYRYATVMQQLGAGYYQALGLDQQEMFAERFDALFQSPAYAYLAPYLKGEKNPAEENNPALRAMVERAIENERKLREPNEIEALLAGLEGRFVMAGPGGDPVRNPDTTSGTNLFALNPEKIPSPEAYAAAESTYRQLVEDYQSKHAGAWPDKLAFSLWSSESIRTLGLSEAQIMWALGVKPVWDQGGRVTHLEIIPAAELNRPRVDTVIQVTSVYRDQFDGIMQKLADVIEQLAELDEADNAIASNSARIKSSLLAKGLNEEEAGLFAQARLFGNPPGSYGSGVTDVAMDSTSWDDDSVLAETFIRSQSHIFRRNSWGTAVGEVGLLQAQLEGVDAVVLSRSSNVHGLLSTDHPFEYLGGLSATAKQVNGTHPELYISNARSAQATMTGADTFLSNELRTRYQNPQWIEGMKREGYAGTVNMLKVVNNLFGWQVMDSNMVRADQWQAMHDTYVMDQRDLGLNEWFAEHNPTAQAQLIERMVEAIRKGYWDASQQTREELLERWQTLVDDLGADAGDIVTREFMQDQAAGFGLSWSDNPSEQADSDAQASTESQNVRGQVMEQVSSENTTATSKLVSILIWFILISSFAAGALRHYQRFQRNTLQTH